MVMDTIRFSFQFNKKNKLNNYGEALVQLVAYKPRSRKSTKHKYISTGIYLKPNQWDLRNSTVINHPLEARLNFRLGDLKNTYQKKVLELINRFGKCSLNDLERDQENNYLSFIEFIEKEIESCQKTKASGTIKTYRTTLSKLKSYRKSIYFTDLNFKFVQNFDGFLHQEKLRKTVIAKYHKILKYFINQAIRKDFLNTENNPYVGLQTKVAHEG